MSSRIGQLSKRMAALERRAIPEQDINIIIGQDGIFTSGGLKADDPRALEGQLAKQHPAQQHTLISINLPKEDGADDDQTNTAQ